MKLSEILRLVWINLIQNKFKVVLTSIGIVVGAATIVMVIAIGRGGQMDVADQFKNLNAGAIDISYEQSTDSSSSNSKGYSKSGSTNKSSGGNSESKGNQRDPGGFGGSQGMPQMLGGGFGGFMAGGNNNNDSSKKELVDKTVNETAGYAIMQQELFGILSLNAGVRYEHSSTYGGEWVPQGGVTVRPFEGNTIRASVSKGFRSPNIREMYMWGAANADLKPESMVNYEVAVGQSFLGGDLYTELTAFFIDGKDMIYSVSVNGDGRPPYKNLNTGTFTNKGIEFEARYQICKNFQSYNRAHFYLFF